MPGSITQTWRKALTQRKGRRVQIVALATGTILSISVGLLLEAFPLGDGLKRASYDLLIVRRGDIAVSDAVMVYMDEESFKQLNQPLNAPWDRSLHAKLVNRLTQAGAKAIIFDIVFSDPIPSKVEADSEFAEAIKKSRRVILAADNVPNGPGSKKAIPPFPLLADAAADIGSDELLPDGDLIIPKPTARRDNALASLSCVTAEFLKLPAL